MWLGISICTLKELGLGLIDVNKQDITLLAKWIVRAYDDNEA